jgi:hypothetical protein
MPEDTGIETRTTGYLNVSFSLVKVGVFGKTAHRKYLAL